LILAILLAFLLPLAVYCLLLAFLNRRHHPTLVHGSWDFAGVLGAASGFLLVGGPAVLAGFNQRWRELYLLGRLPRAWPLEELNPFWTTLLISYFVAVVVVCLLALWRRRLATSVYNVEPAALEEALARVLGRQKRPWGRSANRFVVGAREAAAEGGEIAVELRPFRAMRHVTLRWPAGAGAVRREVEAELEKELADVAAPENPAAVWFLSIAAGLFSLMVFDLFLSLWRIYRENL
jgi:hypothetical protein